MDKINHISGVIISPLNKIENPLGNIFHGMKASDKGYNGFGEAYLSTVNYDIIKPWKKHLKMTLNLIVPVGKIRFVLFDDRVDSSTNGQFMDISLSMDNYSRLTIPPQIWVAFRGEDTPQNILLNIANLEHNIEEVVRLELNKIPYNWN
jgi:dTDP-4-dehydrorhamnose 3,5-epimerase